MLFLHRKGRPVSQLSDLGKEAKHDFDEVSESKKDLPWYKRLSLTTWIFIALALGVVAGIALQGNAEFATTYIKPLGTIFLNLIKMIVVPLVIFTMTAGVISLSDIKRVGCYRRQNDRLLPRHNGIRHYHWLGYGEYPQRWRRV